MSSVTLSGVYLAPVSDYSQQIILQAGVTLSGTSAKAGEVRTYAGGVTRLIKRAGMARSASVSAPLVNRTTRELLETWVGETLLLRDGRGLLMFGTFLELPREENPGLPLCNVSFTFQEITSISVEV